MACCIGKVAEIEEEFTLVLMTRLGILARPLFHHGVKLQCAGDSEASGPATQQDDDCRHWAHYPL